MDPPRASQHRRVTKHDSIFDKHRIYIGQTLGTQRGPLRRRLVDEAFPLHLEKEEKRRPERETHRRGEPREGRPGRPPASSRKDRLIAAGVLPLVTAGYKKFVSH